MEQQKIVHICPRSEWEAARRAGVYRAASLETEGFIHCSRPEQVAAVIERYYRGEPDLVLLWIDPERLEVEVRWEAADGELFPHLYGPLAVGAVTAVEALSPAG
jgi:uncharacterized protein (DUF952 family)